MKKALIISITFTVMLVGFANAQTPNVTNETEIKVKNRLTQKSREINGKSCEVIQERVQNRVELFQSKQEKQLTTFTKIKSKLQRFVDQSNEKGYETTELATDLVEYDLKVKQFRYDYELYMNLLVETKTNACDRSSLEFKAKLQATREQLKTVKRDALELKTFYAKTVRPDILSLKLQDRDLDSENEVSNEN